MIKDIEQIEYRSGMLESGMSDAGGDHRGLMEYINKRYRFETFCYGPKSCLFCRAGVTRKVPGKKE